MTTQQHDILLYNGEETIIYTQPLEKYFETVARPNFISFNPSMIVRGYYAEWKMESGKLFLTNLVGNVFFNHTEVEYGIGDLFQDVEKPIFANWFTGNIATPDEKIKNFSFDPTLRMFNQFEVVDGKLLAIHKISGEELTATNRVDGLTACK